MPPVLPGLACAWRPADPCAACTSAECDLGEPEAAPTIEWLALCDWADDAFVGVGALECALWLTAGAWLLPLLPPDA